MGKVRNFYSRISMALVTRKWEYLARFRLNNLKVNRLLRPANEQELAQFGISLKVINLAMSDYNRLLSTPAMKFFRKFKYVHTKPLEYLTTAKLLNIKEGDSILDAAGGSNGEYIKALLSFSGCGLHVYCQDPLLSGQCCDGITYIGGSIEALPLIDNSLDGISCHHSFEHFRGDLDIRFIIEMIRVLKPGGRLVITPLFLTNKYAEIWNITNVETYDSDALKIKDVSATFPGWGPYEGFARTYSPDAFRKRILNNLPGNCKAEIFQVKLNNNIVPDIKENFHQPLLNAEMKALVLSKETM